MPAPTKPLAALQDMHFTNNIFYFVMEFASGGTLVDYVRKQVGGQTPLLPCCFRQPSKTGWSVRLLAQETRRPVLHAEGRHWGSHSWLLCCAANDRLPEEG